jgi:branched-chain amino acid transport system ATP-binding protein
MLEIRDLHVSYGKVEAVRGVSASAAPGRITLVLGANGAGKSTTLRAVAGLVPAVSGEVVLYGKVITGRPSHTIVRDGLVLVPEGRRVFAPLTVEENLLLGGYVAPRAESAETLDRVYDMFPILAQRRRGAAGLLSGGEQQMLAFGRALMSSPRVMLMDEPSMGLAPAMVESVFGAVREIADAGIALLVVEQNAELGLEIADDVVVVARGEVVFSGEAEQARSDASVVRAFLGEAALSR